MRRALLIILSCFAVFGLIACENQAQAPIQNPPANIPSPTADQSVVTGQILSVSGQAPIKNTSVYLAKVFWDEGHTNAAFALDLANSPVTKTDQNGFFSIPMVEPHEYVIVVGDYYAKNEPIRESDGDARVFTTEAGKTLNIGSVQVNPAVEER